MGQIQQTDETHSRMTVSQRETRTAGRLHSALNVNIEVVVIAETPGRYLHSTEGSS